MPEQNIISNIHNLNRPPNLHFRGRKAELKILENNLLKENYSKSFIQVIAGLAGIGKTELLINFISQNYQNYQICYWVDSSDLEKNLLDLVKEMSENISALTDNNNLIEKTNITNNAQLLKIILGKMDNWLLIFDNIDSFEQFANYIPDCLKGRQHIIVTSRIASWSCDHMLRLNTLSEEESIQVFESWFVGHRTTENDDNNNTNLKTLQKWKQLAESLKYFPLALSHSIIYRISNLTNRLGQFSESLKDSNLESFKDSENSPRVPKN